MESIGPSDRLRTLSKENFNITIPKTSRNASLQQRKMSSCQSAPTIRLLAFILMVIFLTPRSVGKLLIFSSESVWFLFTGNYLPNIIMNICLYNPTLKTTRHGSSCLQFELNYMLMHFKFFLMQIFSFLFLISCVRTQLLN